MSRESRSEKIKELVRQRANGICEACNIPAPFNDANGLPHLVEHHIIPLSEGGSDTEENTAMICPNCHNKIHFGVNAKEFNDQLRKNIQTKQYKIDREREWAIETRYRKNQEVRINQELEEVRQKQDQKNIEFQNSFKFRSFKFWV